MQANSIPNSLAVNKFAKQLCISGHGVKMGDRGSWVDSLRCDFLLALKIIEILFIVRYKGTK
jgi:hypothetical protein